MNTTKTAHEWSKDTLFFKARRYSKIMLEKDPSDWEFGFWSALTLEILVRASISNISPVLVANGTNSNNILYALGRNPNKEKFAPKSADITHLLAMAKDQIPSFTREMLNFSIAHIDRRNRELHSGELPFEGLDYSSWLPKYYSACKVLVEGCGETLESLLGKGKAKEAKQDIAALKDESIKFVKQIISAHKTVWDAKTDKDKAKLSKQAEMLSSIDRGHIVKCPACKSDALVQGSSTGARRTTVDGCSIIETQTMRPSSFECIACSLKITGYFKLVVCNLGNTYTSTNSYDPLEYFEEEYFDVYDF